MAIGVDRAIHLVTDGQEWDPQATAAPSSTRSRPTRAAGAVRPRLLRQRVGRLGRVSGRDPRRACARAPGRDGLKGVVVATAVALRAGGRRRRGRVRAPAARGRDGEGGLNLPRYPSVPGRMRAQRKPLERPSRPRPRRGSRSPARRAGRAQASRPRSSATGPRRLRASSRCCSGSGSRDGRRLVDADADGVDELSLQALAFARRSAAATSRARGVRGVERTVGEPGRRCHVAEHEAFGSYRAASRRARRRRAGGRLGATASCAPGRDAGTRSSRTRARLDLPLAANCTAARPETRSA
jgi:hypothetical protein